MLELAVTSNDESLKLNLKHVNGLASVVIANVASFDYLGNALVVVIITLLIAIVNFDE